jgi:hypothetical protein
LRLTVRNRNLAYVGLAWFLLLTIGITGYWTFIPVIKNPLDEDTVFIYVAVRIGLEHGWNNIYSIDLQRQYYAILRPGAPFDELARYLHPPPLAWLYIPLTLLSPPVGFWTAMVMQCGLLVATWYMVAPGTGWGMPRLLYLLAAFAWYPVLYLLRDGQPVMLVVFALAACWRLADSGRPWLAGVVLAIGVVKPQVVLLVAPCLFLAGYWRVAAAWAASAGILAIVSIGLLGPSGVKDYLSLLDVARHIVFNRYLTLADVVPDPAATIAEVGVAILTLVAAFRMRGSPLARVIYLGVVGSMVSIPYDHLHDFAVLVPAALLFLRTQPPAWQQAWLLVVLISLELVWAITPVPLLLAQVAWLAMIALPLRSQPHVTQGAASAAA